MALRPIHLLGSPVLRETAAPVGEVDADVRTLVQDLVDTMHADSGIGLAANQVGVACQVAVVEVEDGDRLVLIDPVITERTGTERGEEGCLSIPDLFGDVDRAVRITVETTTLDGERTTATAEGLKARAIQHEIDHLQGVLFIDHLSPLKRRMLMAKWKKARKGTTGYLKEVTAEDASSASR
jgi:peptide deformylase